ncbi:type III-A CRISPR-associated protein Csm2 [Methanonatronarchaeum sp. AMET-Sl]|uniref:type III-A CRISPR-associated protein Csm2 n=1 Tax=Methanonatronarchaeum sp. AMET-Sl TaxID=3037654 RepID=UPI00244DC8D0|nr:type III-A CRISPR-associated protein Csm2 [Methanonatronarchaeum sp. AMET-Sl]WGI17163.1 type III-A CRISPR-associated protein Csm2 [Methanonatronarchaeum sp. AMET-Sl]
MNRGAERDSESKSSREIISNKLGDISGENMNDIAEKMGKRHKGNKTQVRRIYNDIKKVQVEWRSSDKQQKAIEETINELHMIKPQLAYTAARKQELSGLKENLEKIINKVEPNKDSIQNFFKLVEAFVGYHRYYTEKSGR